MNKTILDALKPWKPAGFSTIDHTQIIKKRNQFNTRLRFTRISLCSKMFSIPYTPRGIILIYLKTSSNLSKNIYKESCEVKIGGNDTESFIHGDSKEKFEIPKFPTESEEIIRTTKFLIFPNYLLFRLFISNCN